jgi:isoquinoline 1-oxidoreductase beta subunit
LQSAPKLSRRTFIVGSAAVAGGGLALGLNVPFGVGSAQAQAAATEVNIWVAIKP